MISHCLEYQGQGQGHGVVHGHGPWHSDKVATESVKYQTSRGLKYVFLWKVKIKDWVKVKAKV